MKTIIAKTFALLLSALLSNSIAGAATAQQTDPLQRVGRILVIFLENRSFDNLFGLFPGANGIFNAGKAAIQVDEHGKPYAYLPPVRDTRVRPPEGPILDPRFPARMANAPFLIEPYVPQDAFIGDLVHRFYEEQKQINGGQMNRFAGLSDAAGLTMGYYDISNSALWRLAKEYTLADNMFHSAFGGSFLNHIFLICSCALRWDDASPQVREKLIGDGVMTKDGYLVNTIQSDQLHGPGQGPFVPGQTSPPHLGNRLDAKDVKWKWYSGGFNAAHAGHADRLFQFHHQPFVYFKGFERDGDKRKDHLRDLEDLYADIKNGKLPQVAFYKPFARNNLHPSYANFSDGDKHLGDLIDQLMKSPQWSDTLVLITFDEHGGFWDHVAPPKRDAFGPGSRVPLIAVGTMVKRNFIDSTQYDFGSILRTIQLRFGVDPVVEAIDGKATAMRNLLK